jgi:energy-coupling factor transporter ATP-binding protein EcfA2
LEKPLILEELKHLEKELSLFNASDLLVQFYPKDALDYEAGEIALTPNLEKLLKKAQQKEQQLGFVTLSVAEGWIQGNHGAYIPLFIHAINPTVNGVLNTLKWNVRDDEWMLNPHVTGLIQAAHLVPETEKELILEQLKIIGYSVQEGERYVDFFHPFRYTLLREAVALKSQNDLHELDYFFDGSQSIHEKNGSEISQLLFPADQSQFDAVQLGLKQSMVIQGPPGTGKSQVLANLLGLLIHQQQRVLVCSSKKQALDILQQRFMAHKLEDLIYFRNGQNNAKELLSALQHTWSLLENTPKKTEANVALSSVNEFNQQLIYYHQSGMIGPLSPKEFLEETGLNPFEKKTFKTGLPPYELWKKDREILEKIPFEALQLLRQIAPNLHLQAEFEELSLIWSKTLEELESLALRSHSLEEIARHHRVCQAAHLFSGENYRRFSSLLKRKKHLLKLRDELEKLSIHRQPLIDQMEAWRQLPTLEELKYLEGSWQQERFWNRRKIKQQKAAWLRIEGLDWAALIQQTHAFYGHKSKENALNEKLHSFGFKEPTRDFAAFTSFVQLQQSTLYGLYEKLTPEEVISYSERFFRVSKLLSTLQRTLQLSEKKTAFEALSELTTGVTNMLPFLQHWETLSEDTKRAVRNYNGIEDLHAAIVETEWNRFISQNSDMIAFLQLSEKDLDTFARSMEVSGQNLASQLLQQRKSTFDGYHALLAKPNRKLSEQEQQQKELLKAGKRKLVKWFGKKRCLPTVREVLTSEAGIWVQLLKPLWFTNPIQLTLDFELKAKLFDVALIDEASQMPLSHALGTIYRSRRMVVAGDLMQMAPTFYFSGASQERMSILEHASYHLPLRRLKVHYRSRNARLIEFSNARFYENELVVFPCFPGYVAIEDYHVEGFYHEGINLKEIQFLTEIVIKRWSQGVKSIGVITFSDRQLTAWYEHLRKENLTQLWHGIAEGIIVPKTLEQVQGDEFDEMVLSLGFGKNTDGKVDLRMGPLTHFGGEKRLNVLLTRAKTKLLVIRSIKSSDFGMVNSEGLRVLKEWLFWLENLQAESPKTNYSFGKVSLKEGAIEVHRIADLGSNYLNLQSYRSLLRERGWKLRVTSSFEEPDRTQTLP